QYVERAIITFRSGRLRAPSAAAIGAAADRYKTREGYSEIGAEIQKRPAGTFGTDGQVGPDSLAQGAFERLLAARPGRTGFRKNPRRAERNPTDSDRSQKQT